MASFVHASLSCLILLFSLQTRACAVCMGGTPENVIMTYLWITLTLSLIPITIGGFGIYYYKKKSRLLKNQPNE